MDAPDILSPKSGDRRAFAFRFEAKVVAPANDADDKSGAIEGYASTFGNVDQGDEVVDAGAFAKTIQECVPKRAVKLLATHLMFGASVMEVVGTIVEAKEDDRGLWIKASLASTATAQDVRTLVQEGHVEGLSIGFEMLRWEIVRGENGAPDILHHKEVRLLEVTVTAFPMNPEAVITAVKSFGQFATSARAKIAAASAENRKAVAASLFGPDAGWGTLGDAFASFGAALRELETPKASEATTVPVTKTEPVAGLGLKAHEHEARKRRARLLRL